MSTFAIPNESLDSWINELKTYQKSTIRTFLENGSPEEAAEKWLTTIGNPNIASFGGSQIDPKPFWNKFKSECKKFICDENSYVEEKKGLINQSGLTKTIIISTISGHIGSVLGTTGTLVAPAVTLMLFVVGSMSINAYCALD